MVVQGLVLLLTMGVVLLVVGHSFNSRSLHQVDTELVDDTREFSSAASARPATQALDTFATEYLRRQQIEPGTFLVVKTTGHNAVGNEGSQVLKNPQLDRWLASPPTTASLAPVMVGAASYRMLVSPITVSQRPVGVLIAAKDLSATLAASRNVLLLTAGEAGAALLITMVSTYLLLRRVLGIVAKVTETAEQISREGPGRRLQERPTEDEIGRLVQTFNEMLARLEAALKSQRRLLSDVSHQMRTPLTVMRGHLEVARRGGFTDPGETGDTVDLVLDELDHTTALVDSMLFLGRSMEPDFMQPEPVDLRSFLADVYTAAQILAQRHWELGAVPDVVVLLDRDKIRGALLNLIDNAIKATQQQDTIRLEVELGPALAISVVDAGRGIPTELQARIFQRFERGGPADQRGAGLGLAIVKAVTEAHGGHVGIQSAPGAGCSVRIVLPASRILVDQVRPDQMPT